MMYSCCMSLTTLSDDVTWNQTFDLSLCLQIQVTLNSTHVWVFITISLGETVSFISVSWTVHSYTGAVPLWWWSAKEMECTVISQISLISVGLWLGAMLLQVFLCQNYWFLFSSPFFPLSLLYLQLSHHIYLKPRPLWSIFSSSTETNNQKGTAEKLPVPMRTRIHWSVSPSRVSICYEELRESFIMITLPDSGQPPGNLAQIVSVRSCGLPGFQEKSSL